jgi:hypothetical protein
MDASASRNVQTVMLVFAQVCIEITDVTRNRLSLYIAMHRMDGKASFRQREVFDMGLKASIK